MPQRIQRKRTKGWKKPEGAVYVGRPSKWGNDFEVGVDGTVEDCVRLHGEMLASMRAEYREELLAPLRGKDLMCWCPLDQPCHADILLSLANTESEATHE